MKRKIFILLLLLSILVTAMSTIVFATTNANEACMIYSPYMNFAAILDLGGLLSDAENAFATRGYTTTRLADPQPLTMFSNLISKNVQLYFCHGGYVNVNGKSQNFMLLDSGAALTTAPYGDYNIDNNNYTAYCVNDINMSHARLVTLGVCYSAGNGIPEANSIAARMWMNGADSVLGWYDEAQTAPLIKWLKNFYTYLRLGYNFQSAVENTNTEENYGEGSNVQKCHLFVNKNTVLSTEDLEALSSIVDTSDTIKENTLEFDNSKNLKLVDVENIIKSNDSKFNINDYIKEEVEGLYVYNADTGVNENVSRYVNYHLKIGDFSTNSGYTVVLDKDGNIKTIHDNTIKESYSVANIAKSTEQFKVQKNDAQNYLDKAKSEIKDKSNIIDEKVTFTYDLKTNKKYANVTLTFADFSPKTYTYEM